MGILDSLESGLKSVLPYALPAALGAGLGGPLGGLAGVAAAQPDPDEQLKRQKAQLDIESEEAGLQQATQQHAAEQQLLKNPEFLDFFGKYTGMDPSHLSSLEGLGIKGVNDLLKNIATARAAGLKGPIVKTDKGFSVQSPNGLTPLAGIPANVVAERERGEAEGNRLGESIAAAQRRQDTALAARQQMTPAQQQAAMTADINAFTKSYGGAPLTDFGGRLTKWRDNLSKYLQDRGTPKEQADRTASDLAGLKPPKSSVSPPSGFVPLGRTTKDGKPAYYNAATGKYWAPD